MSSADDNEDDENPVHYPTWVQFTTNTGVRIRRSDLERLKLKLVSSSSLLPKKKSVCYGPGPATDAQRLVFVRCKNCGYVIRDVGVSHHLKLRHNFRAPLKETDVFGESGDDSQCFLLSPLHNAGPSTSADDSFSLPPFPSSCKKAEADSTVDIEMNPSYVVEQKKELVLKISKRMGPASSSSSIGSASTTEPEDSDSTTSRKTGRTNGTTKALKPSVNTDSLAALSAAIENGASPLDLSLVPIVNGTSHKKAQKSPLRIEEQPFSLKSDLGFSIGPMANGSGTRKRKAVNGLRRASANKKKPKTNDDDLGPPQLRENFSNCEPAAEAKSHVKPQLEESRISPQERPPSLEPVLPNGVLPLENGVIEENGILEEHNEEVSESEPQSEPFVEVAEHEPSEEVEVILIHNDEGDIMGICASFSGFHIDDPPLKTISDQDENPLLSSRMFDCGIASGVNTASYQNFESSQIRTRLLKMFQNNSRNDVDVDRKVPTLFCSCSAPAPTYQEVVPVMSEQPVRSRRGYNSSKKVVRIVAPEVVAQSRQSRIDVLAQLIGMVPRTEPTPAPTCRLRPLCDLTVEPDKEKRRTELERRNELRCWQHAAGAPYFRTDTSPDVHQNEEGRLIVINAFPKLPPDEDDEMQGSFKEWLPNLFGGKERQERLAQEESRPVDPPPPRSKSGPTVTKSSSEHTIWTARSTTHIRSAQMKVEAEEMKAEVRMQQAVHKRAEGTASFFRVDGSATTGDSTSSFNYAAVSSSYVSRSNQLPEYARSQMEQMREMPSLPSSSSSTAIVETSQTNGVPTVSRVVRTSTSTSQSTQSTSALVTSSHSSTQTTGHPEPVQRLIQQIHYIHLNPTVGREISPAVPRRLFHRGQTQRSTHRTHRGALVYRAPTPPRPRARSRRRDHDDMPVLVPQRNVNIHPLVVRASRSTAAVADANAERFIANLSESVRRRFQSPNADGDSSPPAPTPGTSSFPSARSNGSVHKDRPQ